MDWDVKNKIDVFSCERFVSSKKLWAQTVMIEMKLVVLEKSEAQYPARKPNDFFVCGYEKKVFQQKFSPSSLGFFRSWGARRDKKLTPENRKEVRQFIFIIHFLKKDL